MHVHKENAKCAVIAYRNENYTVELHLIILLALAEWLCIALHYVYIRGCRYRDIGSFDLIF